MSEALRRLKVNKRLAERSCPRCNAALAFGEDAVACIPCQQVYHAACWDEAGGCANKDCENAPIPRLDPPTTTRAEVPAGRQPCPHCGRVYRETLKVCPSCKKAPTPSGDYTGPVTNAPGAVAALVYGILSIFICGLIFGIVAITKAGEAHKAIAKDPTLGGAGLATAGKVIGIIGIVAWALLFLFRVSSMGRG
jgi:hypothetical protein